VLNGLNRSAVFSLIHFSIIDITGNPLLPTFIYVIL